MNLPVIIIRLLMLENQWGWTSLQCVFTKPFVIGRMWYKIYFLAKFSWFEFRVFNWLMIPRLRSPVCLTNSYGDKRGVHAFPSCSISIKWNANSLVLDLNPHASITILACVGLRLQNHYKHLCIMFLYITVNIFIFTTIFVDNVCYQLKKNV